MRWGDNDDEIGIFVKGTISVSVAQPCLLIIFIQQQKRSVVVYVMPNK